MAHLKIPDPLRSWGALNKHLIQIEDLSVAKDLLAEELAGKKRGNFVTRIHQRVCALRSKEERVALTALVKKVRKK